MKLSEYKNEDALELLADILDPLAEIMTDPKIREFSKDKKANRMQVIQYLLKNHAKSIIAVFARIDNTPVEKFDANILSMTTKLLEVFNDKDFIDFFRSQGQMLAGEPSGSVTESTEETGEA